MGGPLCWRTALGLYLSLGLRAPHRLCVVGENRPPSAVGMWVSASQRPHCPVPLGPTGREGRPGSCPVRRLAAWPTSCATGGRWQGRGRGPRDPPLVCSAQDFPVSPHSLCDVVCSRHGRSPEHPRASHTHTTHTEHTQTYIHNMHTHTHTTHIRIRRWELGHGRVSLHLPLLQSVSGSSARPRSSRCPCARQGGGCGLWGLSDVGAGRGGPGSAAPSVKAEPLCLPGTADLSPRRLTETYLPTCCWPRLPFTSN